VFPSNVSRLRQRSCGVNESHCAPLKSEGEVKRERLRFDNIEAVLAPEPNSPVAVFQNTGQYVSARDVDGIEIFLSIRPAPHKSRGREKPKTSVLPVDDFRMGKSDQGVRGQIQFDSL
jgi:hypothetical protein